MTTNDGCRADVRKARAEAAGVDPTAAAVRAAQAEAWDEAVQALAWALDNGPTAAALAYVAKNNPYRADRLATDTAAPEGVLSEEYAENLIGFVRTFETGEAAAGALPIFLRTATRPAAPVAVEGVETVETLAEADPLADAQGQYANKSIAEIVHDYAVIRGDLSEQYARDQLVRIITARIVQARAGEGALRERVEQIHFPIPLLAYAEDCLSPDEHEWMDADDGTELCRDCPHDDLRACSTCRDRDGGLYVDWPCETAAALTPADPS